MAQIDTIDIANLQPQSRLRLKRTLERQSENSELPLNSYNQKIQTKIKKIENSPNTIYWGLLATALFIDLFDFAVFAIKLIPLVGTAVGMALSFIISSLFTLTSFFYYHIQDHYEEIDIGNLNVLFRITIISVTLFIEGILPFLNILPVTAVASFLVFRHVLKLREQEIEALKKKLIA